MKTNGNATGLARRPEGVTPEEARAVVSVLDVTMSPASREVEQGPAAVLDAKQVLDAGELLAAERKERVELTRELGRLASAALEHSSSVTTDLAEALTRARRERREGEGPSLERLRELARDMLAELGDEETAR